MTTIYPTGASSSGTNTTTWSNMTTSATVLDLFAVQQAFNNLRQELSDARSQLWETRRELNFFTNALDWLAKNPGNTLDDYRKFVQVTTTIGEAIHGTSNTTEAYGAVSGNP